MADLPSFPALKLRVVDDVTPPRARDGFLQLQRWKLELTFPDGHVNPPFAYDEVTRNALDAVCMVAWYRHDGVPFVFLRSCFRPPAAMRPREHWITPEKPTLGHLWEVPAGLVEPSERSPEGLLNAAAREIEEELGFDVSPAALRPLGPGMFSAPGMCAERIFPFEVEVDPASRHTPSEDGSPLERSAVIVAVRLSEALQACARGEIEDTKTELSLRRIAERLAL
jgi:ADP-ribose pyrophosphatase